MDLRVKPLGYTASLHIIQDNKVKVVGGKGIYFYAVDSRV